MQQPSGLAEPLELASEEAPSESVDEEAGAEEVLEISRALFESRLRNLAFASWDDFRAALADRPSARGYTALRGASETVVKLDPVRVWGWVAVLLLNICFWGFVGYLQSALLGCAFSALYGGVLWAVLSRGLVDQLTDLFRPNLACAVAGGGYCLAAAIGQNLGVMDDTRAMAGLALPCVIFPHLLVAGAFMSRLPEDPDRATLVPNLFLGVWAALQALFVLLTGDYSWNFAGSSLLLLGFAAVATASRLFIIPGRWGSVELISWTLNVGALAVFVAGGMLLEVPFTGHPLSWLMYCPLPLALSLLGTTLGRSFPVLLGALGSCFIVAWLSMWAGGLAGSPVASFGVLALLGGAAVFVVQWLPKSGLWAGLSASLRAGLARACGAAPPCDGLRGRAAASPYFRDAAAGAPPPRRPTGV